MRHQRLFAEDQQRAADRQTASLAGLALTLALVVAGLFLTRVLRAPEPGADLAVVSDPSADWQ